jgi:hypothetical protein
MGANIPEAIIGSSALVVLSIETKGLGQSTQAFLRESPTQGRWSSAEG